MLLDKNNRHGRPKHRKRPYNAIRPILVLYLHSALIVFIWSGLFYWLFFFFFFLRRMGKNKALAHHTSTCFHTRRVSIELSCFRSPTLAGLAFSRCTLAFCLRSSCCCKYFVFFSLPPHSVNQLSLWGENLGRTLSALMSLGGKNGLMYGDHTCISL